eukprot:gene308-561_t
MAEQEDHQRTKPKASNKTTERVHPATIFAEDMTDDWSRDAVKAARDAFALTIASGDVHATIADFIRKKFDRDHERGWNCIVGRSFGAYVTHEIKTSHLVNIYKSEKPSSRVNCRNPEFIDSLVNIEYSPENIRESEPLGTKPSEASTILRFSRNIAGAIERHLES